MESRLPLPALLSCLTVAFTIEFDNEAERRMPPLDMAPALFEVRGSSPS
jgi:hypothetical protein